MKRVILSAAVLSALVLPAPMLVVAALPASASAFCDGLEETTDETGPTFLASSVSPTAVVIGKVKRTLTVTVRAADVCGVNDVSVELTLKGNSSAGSVFLFNFTRIAGTPENGTWRGTTVLSDYLEGGTYVPTEIELWDNNFNRTTRVYGQGSVQVRHATTTTLKKPTSKVKKNKKVTIKGDIEIHGDFHASKVSVQTRTSTKKKWTTVKTVNTDFFGFYETKIKVTKTKYYRVIHKQDSTTTASNSKSYKVKKK